MNILFCSDKQNVFYKKKVIEEIKKIFSNNEINVVDINDGNETNIVDDTINAVKNAKKNYENFKLIIIDNFGSASFMTASKFRNTVVAQLEDEHSARMTRDHNNTNIICLGTYNIGLGLAINIINKFIKSNYSGGRHQVRVDMLETMLNKEDN